MNNELEQLKESINNIGYKCVFVKNDSSSAEILGDEDVIPYFDFAGYTGNLQPYDRTRVPLTQVELEEVRNLWLKIADATSPAISSSQDI
jgi:hypothetical protein